MQTHPDSDAETSSVLRQMFSNLEARAKDNLARGDTVVTAGKPGEQALAEERIGDVSVKRLPDDPDCLRVSIGGPDIPNQFTYLVFRGHPKSAEEQIRRAYEAIIEFNSRESLRK